MSDQTSETLAKEVDRLVSCLEGIASGTFRPTAAGRTKIIRQSANMLRSAHAAREAAEQEVARVRFVAEDIERTWPDARVHGPNTNLYGHGLRTAADRILNALQPPPSEG